MRILFLIYLFCISCATGNIYIDTVPQGSPLYIKSNSTNEFILIGNSPLQVKSAEIKDTYNLTGPIAFKVTHDGFLQEYTYVTELPYNSDINILLTLKPEYDSEKNLKLNKLMDQIFESQRLAKVGRYEEALKTLSTLQKDNPQLAVVYEMQGGIFYIQEQYNKALDAYEIAARLNPESLELLSMKRYLQKKTSTNPTKTGAKDGKENIENF
jgi:tetratricopeptide (TPR) repeat protein